MTIATSQGAVYEDEFQHAAGVEIPKEVVKPKDTGDDNVVPPDDNPPAKSGVMDVSDEKSIPQPEPHRSIADKLLGTTGPRYQLWPEKMLRSLIPDDVVQGVHNIMTGQTPMWAMDPETGEFHTSPEGIAEGVGLAGLSTYGSGAGTSLAKSEIPLIVHLRGEVRDALEENASHLQDALRTFRGNTNAREVPPEPPRPPAAPGEWTDLHERLLNGTETAADREAWLGQDHPPTTDPHQFEQEPFNPERQYPQPESSPDTGGHPMDPRAAAEHYQYLQENRAPNAAIRFAHEYEDIATTEQFSRYLDHVDYLSNYRDSVQIPRNTLENPLRRSEPPAGWRYRDETGYSLERDTSKRVADIDNVQARARPAVEEAMKGPDLKLIKNDYLSGGNSHSFYFANENGIGRLNLRETEGGKNLHVNWMGKGTGTGTLDEFRSYAEGPGTFGFKEVKSVLNQLKDEFPDAETITGFRVSGARVNSGKGSADAIMRIRPPKPELPRLSPEELLRRWNQSE